jgi:ATP:ADP antiporter, AAA family
LILSRKITTFFKIKPGELYGVSLSFIYAFFIGSIEMQTFVACLGLFLGKFQIGVMPYVYIITSILSLSFGSIYSYFAKRVIVSTLLNGTLIILGLALFLMNTLFSITGYVSYVFAMLCLANFIYCFCDLIFESQINNLFTLQQAKRLLGIVSSGKIIGGIVAGLVLSWLATTIKTTYIIFNISILFLLALYLQIKLQHYYPHRFSKKEKQNTLAVTGKKQKTSSVFVRKKYILYIIALVAILKFGNDAFDFLFNGVAQQYYNHQTRLTVYLGIVLAAVDGLNLFISIFLFNRIAEKIGVILMLCLQPAIMTVLMIGMQFAHGVNPSLGILLIFVTITQLLDGAARYSINSPALLILLQPLSPEERALARAKQTTLTMPLVTIFSGFALLLFAKNPIEHIHIFTALFITLSAASLILLYQFRALYLKELIATLYNRIFVKPEWISDRFSLTVLKKAAHSKNVTERLYALTVLETLNLEEFTRQLLETLDPSNRDSFLYALTKIDEHHINAAAPRLLTLYSEMKNDEELLAKIVLTLGTLSADEHMELFNDLLDAAQRSVRESAMVVCLKHGKSAPKERAQQLLNQMIHSSQSEARISAAKILRHLNQAEYQQTWEDFLRDNDVEVRKTACTAIRDIPNEAFYPALVENLLIPSVKNAASMAILAQPHKTIIPYILTMIF